MVLLWVTPLEVAFTENGNVPGGVGPGGALLLPPQEMVNANAAKHNTALILLKRLRVAPSRRANTMAKEYQSFEPGLCKDAAGRAVVLTLRLMSKNSPVDPKETWAGENTQLAPCGRLLQLNVTMPIKAVGPGGMAAPEIVNG